MFAYQIDSNEFKRLTDTINSLYDNVISRNENGEERMGYCIQMMSLRFLSTGLFYLNFFYHYSVQGINLSKIRFMHY